VTARYRLSGGELSSAADHASWCCSGHRTAAEGNQSTSKTFLSVWPTITIDDVWTPSVLAAPGSNDILSERRVRAGAPLAELRLDTSAAAAPARRPTRPLYRLPFGYGFYTITTPIIGMAHRREYEAHSEHTPNRSGFLPATRPPRRPVRPQSGSQRPATSTRLAAAEHP